jgi:hypothetical protein
LLVLLVAVLVFLWLSSCRPWLHLAAVRVCLVVWRLCVCVIACVWCNVAVYWRCFACPTPNPNDPSGCGRVAGSGRWAAGSGRWLCRTWRAAWWSCRTWRAADGCVALGGDPYDRQMAVRWLSDGQQQHPGVRDHQADVKRRKQSPEAAREAPMIRGPLPEKGVRIGASGGHLARPTWSLE